MNGSAKGIRSGDGISPDSLRGDPHSPQSFNLFAYVSGNPLNSTDPLGLDGDNGKKKNQAADIAWTLYLDITVSGPGGGGSDVGRPPEVGGGGGSPDPEGDPDPGTGAEKPGIKHTKNCGGYMHVLQGNTKTIGKPGGFSGDTVGDYLVTGQGGAIIPRQWEMTKKQLRPYLDQITGVFPGAGGSFHGVVDVIGNVDRPKGFPPNSNVQDDLMIKYPNNLILEWVSAPKDLGTIYGVITEPAAMPCPAFTVEVP